MLQVSPYLNNKIVTFVRLVLHTLEPYNAAFSLSLSGDLVEAHPDRPEHVEGCGRNTEKRNLSNLLAYKEPTWLK